MGRSQPLSTALVALVALAVGFLLAGQVKAQLLTPSNQVGRSQALIRSVQDLERTNQDDRARIEALRAEIDTLEATAAGQSQTTEGLKNQVADLRAHAGLTALHGPGVEVDLTAGPPGSDPSGQNRNLITYQDVQDVVNLLFASGAEGVSVSGRRITPVSSFTGSEGEVIIDQGPPLFSPIKIVAVGDRNGMEAALGDANSVPSLRIREIQFGLALHVSGGPNESLPAFDGSLEAPHVSAA
ncbi:MAG TPA: DUF881 domain-containing protein [Candidatus Dormibacteraeota bacterium]|nr:DUF881 domain-containing protein [Candidatus Dormibacteraeota bacterium]